MQLVSEGGDLNVRRGPDCLFVTVRGDPYCDHDWPTLANRVEQLLEQHATSRLVLDLDQGRQLCGVQISQMLAIQEWLRGHQGSMRVCGLSPEVKSLFQGCGLDRLFYVCDE